ncbi:hypothetical protein LTR36_007398 [Oleoguttula mirabilis]|uniref:J domain-containing protein n=1 Tax=Oleoguttula mirabilis TaxID=1507867 RepID=A0AAV9J9A7_9PEZI|nr:hypothetical protein LTR36_007398 [Oleoguttula mirabilis]
MGSPLPEDPYLALGVPKDAPNNTIKTQYRKLVLKFHPDKVQDESHKQAAVDQFHKIQTAYEIIGDEDRRARYDAQCKLAELRKDVMEKQGGGGRTAEVRTAAYKMPTESVRGGAFYARGPERREEVSPQYEERRPAYASAHASDYFDTTSRVGARKDGDYERSSKRTPPAREDRERVKTPVKDPRESERARQKERTSRREKDIRQDRDRKTAYAEDNSDSDEDEYESQARRMKQEDDLRKAKTTYHEQARRDKEDAARPYYEIDERTRKIYSQYDEARDYIGKASRPKQMPEDERRPSPVRMASSKDKVDYIRRTDGRPGGMMRRASAKPKTTGREPEERRSSAREPERRSSAEIDEPRRAPPLTTAKSSPSDIRIPAEKLRSQSMQTDAQERQERDDFVPPLMKRSTTMPNVHARERDPRRKEPQKGSSLRQAENVDSYPTPAATPEVSGAPPKYRYNREYADDTEYATPDGYRTADGYRTEVLEPKVKTRLTRSPSPVRDTGRDKGRTASARYAPPSPQRPAPPRTTSTSYVYGTNGVEQYSRPGVSRESSKRGDPTLYGELPTTTRDLRSPRQSTSRYSPPEEGVKYTKDFKTEDVRVQSGYGSRRPSMPTRPSYARQGSYSTVGVR